MARVTGSWHDIRLEDGTILPSRIIGKLRMDDIKTTNPVGVGDEVEVQYEAGDEFKGVITEVLPRRNYIVRQSPRRKHDLHLLASNVDQAVLVTTIVSPMLKMGFIDRFLLMTEPHNIPVIIVINKNDLFGEEEKEIFGGLKIMYEDIGYRVISCSAQTGEGVDELRGLLKNKRQMKSPNTPARVSIRLRLLKCFHWIRVAISLIHPGSRCCLSTIWSRWMSRIISGNFLLSLHRAVFPTAYIETNRDVL